MFQADISKERERERKRERERERKSRNMKYYDIDEIKSGF